MLKIKKLVNGGIDPLLFLHFPGDLLPDGKRFLVRFHVFTDFCRDHLFLQFLNRFIEFLGNQRLQVVGILLSLHEDMGKFL